MADPSLRTHSIRALLKLRSYGEFIHLWMVGDMQQVRLAAYLAILYVTLDSARRFVD